jgi:hypothetical protein
MPMPDTTVTACDAQGHFEHRVYRASVRPL